MKKLKLTYLILCFTAITAHAQILSGIGVAGGLTYGTQRWTPEGPWAQERWLLRFNGAVLAEFFHHPTFRWRTEIEYNLMGTKELTYPPSSILLSNRTNYFSWNNYLKIMYNKYTFVPYILIGPRIEYKFRIRPQIYPGEMGALNVLQVTGCVGVGVELMWSSPWRPFIELLYNHDLMPSYNNISNNGLTQTKILYEGFELRIGVKFFNDKSKKDKCPAVYNPMGN
jgi:hypothetical protein